MRTKVLIFRIIEPNIKYENSFLLFLRYVQVFVRVGKCIVWDIVTSCRRKPIGNTSSTGCDRHKYIHNAHCTQHTKQTVQYNHTLYSAHYTEHTSQYTLIN